MLMRRWIAILGSVLGALMAAPAAAAEDGWSEPVEPPGRVGFLAVVQGTVWVRDDEAGEWISADRNRPVVQGDRLWVDRDGRAELRIGPTVLRLTGDAEIDLLVLDQGHMSFGLERGSVALRVPTQEHARQIEVLTREGRFEPMRAGHYRFDREDDTTLAAVWQGELQFSGSENVRRIDQGERIEVLIDSRGFARTRTVPMPSDRFAAWALEADRNSPTPEAYRYVSPEMSGAEDLDRYGRWIEHPEFGFVWTPYDLSPGWEPYREGRWVWVRPWGWTWVDAAPWGFAPSHYGRWVSWRGRWCWWPGVRHARPVFAPAWVAWVGGPQVGITVRIGGHVRPAPPVSWVPLRPHQPYVPGYRSPPHRPLPDVRPPHPRHDVRPPPRARRDEAPIVDRPRAPEPRDDRARLPDRRGRPDGRERIERPEPPDRTDRPNRAVRPDPRGGPEPGTAEGATARPGPPARREERGEPQDPPRKRDARADGRKREQVQ